VEKRWEMCPRCGVKMLLDVDEDEVEIYVCPCCKDGYMTLSGGLLEEVKKLSETQNKSIEELIIDTFKGM